jgi:hypothetical protein
MTARGTRKSSDRTDRALRAADVPSGSDDDDLLSNDPSTVPLDVARPLEAPLDLARVAAAFDEPAWLGPLTRLPGSPTRWSLELDIGFGLGSDAMTVRKAAVAEMGQVRVADGSVTVDVDWRAATFAPLFPVFAGHLVVGTDRIGLHGRYAPPFGRIGLVVDRALLHLVATGTAMAFLARVVAALQDLG